MKTLNKTHGPVAALLFIALVAGFSGSRPAGAWEDLGKPALALTDRQRDRVEQALKQEAPADWTAVRQAVAIEPRIIDRALEASALDAGWLEQGAGSPILSDGLLAQLRTRSALIGIADGRIGAATATDQAVARHQALSVGLGQGLDPQHLQWIPASYAALRDSTTIVNPIEDPICESSDCGTVGAGLPLNNGAGSQPLPPIGGCISCIRNDPWEVAHFRSVSRILTRDGKFLCTGIVLDATTILTAAHCVTRGGNRVPKSDVRVMIPGVADLTGVDDLLVPKGLISSSGMPVTDLDIAIIAISGIAFPADFEFARIPKDRPTGKSDVTIAGYGRNTVFALTDVSMARLLVGRQEIDFDAFTARSFQWQVDATNSNLSSICQGDSGGPMFVGKTRLTGDALSVAGVVHRTETLPERPGTTVPGDADASNCTHAQAELLNLYDVAVRTGLCSLGRALDGYCS